MNCKLLYNYTEMSAIDYAIHYKYPEAALGMASKNILKNFDHFAELDT